MLDSDKAGCAGHTGIRLFRCMAKRKHDLLAHLPRVYLKSFPFGFPLGVLWNRSGVEANDRHYG